MSSDDIAQLRALIENDDPNVTHGYVRLDTLRAVLDELEAAKRETELKCAFCDGFHVSRAFPEDADADRHYAKWRERRAG